MNKRNVQTFFCAYCRFSSSGFFCSLFEYIACESMYCRAVTVLKTTLCFICVPFLWGILQCLMCVVCVEQHVSSWKTDYAIVCFEDKARGSPGAYRLCLGPSNSKETSYQNHRKAQSSFNVTFINFDLRFVRLKIKYPILAPNPASFPYSLQME